jgi:hypothetical protein
LGYYLGLIGIILGTALAGLLTSTWYLPLLTARLFKRSWLQFVRQDAMPVLALGICLLPIAFFTQAAGKQIGGFVGAAVGAGLTGLVGGGLLWLIVLDPGLRSMVLDTVTRATRNSWRRTVALSFRN